MIQFMYRHISRDVFFFNCTSHHSRHHDVFNNTLDSLLQLPGIQLQFQESTIHLINIIHCNPQISYKRIFLHIRNVTLNAHTGLERSKRNILDLYFTTTKKWSPPYDHKFLKKNLPNRLRYYSRKFSSKKDTKKDTLYILHYHSSDWIMSISSTFSFSKYYGCPVYIPIYNLNQLDKTIKEVSIDSTNSFQRY